MKRDMDLVRTLLMEVEKLPYDGAWHEVRVAGHSENEISYHVLLLHEAGLIEAIDLSTMDGMCWMPKRLTNEGHEFLDAARNDKMWARAKDTALRSAGTLTIEAIKLALAALVRQAMTGA